MMVVAFGASCVGENLIKRDALARMVQDMESGAGSSAAGLRVG